MKLLMTLMAILIFSSYAVAQDDPCADESGAGYGLCNAYCVAMNCDSPDLQESSTKACEKVATNYAKITGNTLSCGGGGVCPCFSQQEFDILIDLGNNDSQEGPNPDEPYFIVKDLSSNPTMELQAIYHGSLEWGACFKINSQGDPPFTSYQFYLSLEDTMACFSLFEANYSRLYALD